MKIAAVLALLVSAPVLACPGLDVEDAWIRAAPPAATKAAGYAKLVNTGSRPLVVDGASSATFGAVELHRTVLEDGVYRMRGGTLALAPGARQALEPGGWHLMLFRPQRPLAAGDEVPVRLQCGEGAAEFTFVVRAAGS